MSQPMPSIWFKLVAFEYKKRSLVDLKIAYRAENEWGEGAGEATQVLPKRSHLMSV